MTDKELLELAAKAARLKIVGWNEYDTAFIKTKMWPISGERWNPLNDDGHALRLAVKLNLSIRFDACLIGVVIDVGGEWNDAPHGTQETYERDSEIDNYAATRRAIVRAAAEIGKATGEQHE